MKRATIVSQFNLDRIPLHEAIPLESPLVIYVEPSSFCNLECRFCPQHISPQHLHKQNMTLATFGKLVDDIKAFKSRPKKIRYCGTGEPLFNKDLLTMVKMATEADVADNFELITNGYLLNDKLIDELPKYLDKIIVSIEGLSAADYKEFSLRKVDYQALVSKVQRLSSNPQRRAVIHVKIHKTAIRSENDLKNFYETFGYHADEINVEGLVDMWPGADFSLGNVTDEHRFTGEINHVKACPQIFKGVQVNSDGRVIPCCADWAAINVLGDIHDESLDKIWTGDRLKQLRIRHLEGQRHTFKPCNQCTMNEYCEKDNIDSDAQSILDKIK